MTTPDHRPALRAQGRDILGKNVRFLRRQGLTPANLFGRGQESLALQIESRALDHALTQGAAYGLLDLTVDGDQSPRAVVLRAVQRHPTTRVILHADLYQVEADRLMRAEVPLSLTGRAPAADVRGVMIVQQVHTLEVECLPAALPSSLEIDISSLAEADQALFVSDLRLPPGVTLRADSELLLVHAVRSRTLEEPVAAGQEAVAAPEEGAETATEERGRPGRPGER